MEIVIVYNMKRRLDELITKSNEAGNEKINKYIEGQKM